MLRLLARGEEILPESFSSDQIRTSEVIDASSQSHARGFKRICPIEIEEVTLGSRSWTGKSTAGLWMIQAAEDGPAPFSGVWGSSVWVYFWYYLRQRE